MSNRLTIFKIFIIGSNPSSANAPYSNGNQQCSVEIQILKVNSDGDPVRLSQAEINSIKVGPYSSDQVYPQMPPGWFCDTTKNIYDDGSPQNRTSEDDQDEGEQRNQKPELFRRYLRCDSRASTYKFMACMRLDASGSAPAKYVSSYYHNLNESMSFDSSITLQPRGLYRVLARDLEPTHKNDDNAYRNDFGKGSSPSYIDIDVHYWTLPSGLRIRHERFENVAADPNEKFKVAYVIHASSYRTGGALSFEATTLTVGDTIRPFFVNIIPTNMINEILKSPPYTDRVQLVNSATLMRAVRVLTDGESSARYDRLLKWIITDNYGTEHRFTLKSNSSDKGNTFTLMDG